MYLWLIKERAFHTAVLAMDSVPKLFIENVNGSLSKQALEALKCCHSLVWQKEAEHMWRMSREIGIHVVVPLDGDQPLHRYTIHDCAPSTFLLQRLSLDDLRRTRYARISMEIFPWSLDDGEESNNKCLNSVFANAKHVEKLRMGCADRFDSLFQNFFPLSVSTIEITTCTFAKNSVFPEWLQKTLRSNSLQELSIRWTTVEGRTIDVEEDIFHQSLAYRRNLKICMFNNRKLTNLNAEFFQRALDLWTNLEKPFPRKIRYDSPYFSQEGSDPLRNGYFKGEESILHKSGSGKVTWKQSATEMIFTP
uniref:FBA_2 domain-containing protein n=1 Tax=Steinernema glaseri TaxID=37863 RepID=A0A1I7ZWQ4_9BILA